MRFSVCIDMMFADSDFMTRIDRAHAAGIDTVEFWKWTNKDIDAVCQALKERGMRLSVFNIDSTDEQLSYDLSRGILNAGRADEFVKALEESIPVYKKLGASAMIVLIGEHAPYCRENVKKCLEAALPILAEHDVTLIIEPLNSFDRQGYSMPYAAPVLDLLREINSPHVKMLYDLYHQNMMGDFSMDEIKENIAHIGHFHVADVPGRHQPGTGHVDYRAILSEISKTGYDGCIGLEYRATVPDEQTFDLVREFENK